MSLSIEKIKKIRPLGDRVLVERAPEKEAITAGGIVIPDQAKERAQTGKVIAVGAGKILSNGTLQSLSVKMGDEVFFGKYAGTEVAENYILLREDELLGIL